MNTKMNFSGSSLRLSMLIIFGIFSFTTASTFAQKTNYSGSWTLNEGKSNLGENRFRMGLKITATQDANALNLERLSKGRDDEDRVTKEKYTLDGTECENTVFQTTVRKSKATWSSDGKILTINSIMTFERDGEKMEMKSTESWNLSADGKTLTIESTMTTPNGDVKQTRVYDKV
jgi:hypothetical protein